MFEVAPQGGWRNNLLITKTSVILIANVILLSVLTCVWLTSKENKNRFHDTGTHRIPLPIFTIAMDLMNWQRK